jgi:hypothetical protein
MTPKNPRRSPKSVAPVIGPSITLSPSASALYEDVRRRWDLSPPVHALLVLAVEAQTKAQECEAITAREGMTIGDAKGAAKPHPAALLARDYRAQSSNALQRLLAHLEG